MVTCAHRLVAALCAMLLFGAGSARASCPVLPAAEDAAWIKHEVTPDDLLGLRDIGIPAVAYGEPSPVAVAPDGRHAALVLSRAEAASNRYCRGLVIVDLEGRERPRLVDSGGDLITDSDPFNGYYTPDGGQPTIVPVWSPDGSRIAYRRRDRGVTQAWVANVDGSGARAVTADTVDVDAIAWGPGDGVLVFADRPGIAVANAAIDSAGLSGWLYDASILPDYGPRPMVAGPIGRRAHLVSLGDGTVRDAGPAEAGLLPPELAFGASAAISAVAATGARAGVRKTGDALFFAPTVIDIDRPGKARVTCAAEPCTGGVQYLWWNADGTRLYLQRREGWNRETNALYVIDLASSGTPRLVLATTDALLGCQLLPAGLLCLRENATAPRRLVLIDLGSGSARTVFDPNPQVASWRFGAVRRLRWKNTFGLEAWGDLVLPPDIGPHEKVPLVIVQYDSKGFLRGGTGDEYPVYALAAQGMAVLSIERSISVAQADPKVRTIADYYVVFQKDWGERRSQLSSLEAGVRAAIATGAIDPRRIGITGLSDGSSTVRFALINSGIAFRAAAISSCCVELRTTMTYGGIAWAEFNKSVGYPPASNEDEAYWRPYSMVLNATRMTTPLLMQLADREYLLSLETVTALREHHQPVEMYVFPNEFHLKWQPAHRAAIYRRNIDWFAFWLQDRIDRDPAKDGQYRRWEAMRASLEAGHVGSDP